MKRISRFLRSVAERGRRLFGGDSAEPSDEEFRARLLAGLDSVRGVEIDDVYPAGTSREEVHR